MFARRRLSSPLFTLSVGMVGAVMGAALVHAATGGAPILAHYDLVATFHDFDDATKVLDTKLRPGACIERAANLSSRTGYGVSFACVRSVR